MSGEPANQALEGASEANREFADLVDSLRLRALWYLAPDVRVEITRPEADRILNAIARAGDRAAWLRARRLQAWRSLHCK